MINNLVGSLQLHACSTQAGRASDVELKWMFVRVCALNSIHSSLGLFMLS